MDRLFPRLLSYAYIRTSHEREESALVRLDDNALVIEYQNGNEYAFSLLVKRHLSGVYSYAYRLTHDAVLAEDIAQETFIKAWKKISSYKQGNNVRAWIFSIAHNTTIDILRQKKIFVFSDFDRQDGTNPLIETLVDENPTAQELLVLNEKGILLSQSINQLSTLDQIIVTLHYNEELTFAEISEILEKPLNTVKSRHQRAIQTLGQIRDLK